MMLISNEEEIIEKFPRVIELREGTLQFDGDAQTYIRQSKTGNL
jgi:hypothetical protein